MDRSTLLAAALGMLAAASTPATGSTRENAPLAERLGAAIAPMIDAHRGVVTVAVEHVPSGETLGIEADRPMPSASLIKLPIMVAAYEAQAAGGLSLEKTVTLRKEDKVPGSGVLTEHFSPGVTMPLRDAIRLMIRYSDNTATNLVLGEVGIPAVNALMERLGYKNTRLNSFVFRRDTSVAPERSAKFGLGMMNGSETVALYKRLLDGDPFGADQGGPKASPEACREMLDHLRACEARSMVPRKLPKGTVVAHKTGAVNDARCDAGVIESPAGPIIYCVMTAENEDQSWGDENEAELLGAELGLAIYDAVISPRGGRRPPAVARVLRMGDGGPMVEALQRTLNARLDPRPNLGVDGDFGPNTQEVVRRLQQEAGLEPTGEVDSATWNALGPLAPEDASPPIPAPAEVDATNAERTNDTLVGPPVTTCAAWAIADAETGELVAGRNEDLQRDPASITKIMTAHLVLRLAAADPAVLDERITFSEDADRTSGSSSEVRAGEQVSAGELLYGLMLPSGNDASVAFAEHFGDRMPSADGARSPYERFVAAMNTEAQRLGMASTAYRNTHGLTAEGHVTTAADMLKLAREAMRDERFRRVVSTQARVARLGSVDGYTREVLWRNSNQLLKYREYDGVKTGTTDRAGACLVASGGSGGRRLLVVVLGATSGDARYVDARNLFHWAWSRSEESE